jgi:hypothetical protein
MMSNTFKKIRYSQTIPGYSPIQYLNNTPIHNSTLFRLLRSSAGLIRENIASYSTQITKQSV